jgi:hypothetical protein
MSKIGGWSDPRSVFGTGIDWETTKKSMYEAAYKGKPAIMPMPTTPIEYELVYEAAYKGKPAIMPMPTTPIEPVDFSFLTDYIIEYELVGSRITVDPPPTDTDLDVLILCEPDLDAAISACHRYGFNDDGSYKELPSCFWSVRRGDLNLILTNDKEFYDLFCLASYVCKTLNVVSKKDRITVFQAILYRTKK